MAYGHEGERVNLPPVPEALNRAGLRIVVPDVGHLIEKYTGEGNFYAKVYVPVELRYPIQSSVSREAKNWDWQFSKNAQISMWIYQEK